MNEAQVSAPANAVLQLNSSLEIKDVEDAHKQLLRLLESGSAMTIDIGHVAAMDTAGVQLMLAFQTEAARRGLTLEYTGQSEPFSRALTAVGLVGAVPHVVSRD